MTSRPSDWSPLLVLAPHPDDDVLGCSRLMQRVAARGGGLVIAWLTDGGASHGALPENERTALVQRRRAEAQAGVQALGIVPLAMHFLDFADGTLAQHIAPARLAVAAICLRHGVQTVIVTDKDDGHPDHRAAYAIAVRLKARRLLSYPISKRYDGADYRPPTATYSIAAHPQDGKRAALLRHVSQMEPAAIYPLSLAAIERFCAEPEYYLPIRTPDAR
jgi:LmbE family N-acetylglucosaminyl deacetylase